VSASGVGGASWAGLDVLIMIIIILMVSCEIDTRTERIEEKLNKILDANPTEEVESE